jgi:hypothetical protein
MYYRNLFCDPVHTIRIARRAGFPSKGGRHVIAPMYLQPIDTAQIRNEMEIREAFVAQQCIEAVLNFFPGSLSFQKRMRGAHFVDF